MKDGGPAFPVLDYNANREQMECFNSGMTVRDWFAGQVLAGICSANPVVKDVELAQLCYSIADSMIAQLEADKKEAEKA
jgi:hypothetical protein